jgi:predicted phosphohydrolase
VALYAIGDLHLSLSVDKPMDIFGEAWVKHEEKIKEYWLEHVSEEDTVLIPGDISWATTFEEAKIDLKWIDDLPGKKLLLRGNHDYWWTSLKRMTEAFPDMFFVQNNYYEYDTYLICGTRGWVCPNKQNFDGHDEKIYKRELIRLKLSLDSARKVSQKPIIVMTHYPPTNEAYEASGFTELYESYGVSKVIYGHLHTEVSFKCGMQGIVNGVEYQLVSSDYVDFKLQKIVD